ncbi:MAG: hypothetical protein ABIJ97_00110 [Bacteroidota bacterium]
MKTKINNLFESSNKEKPKTKKPYKMGQKSAENPPMGQTTDSLTMFPGQLKKK